MCSPPEEFSISAILPIVVPKSSPTDEKESLMEPSILFCESTSLLMSWLSVLSKETWSPSSADRVREGVRGGEEYSMTLAYEGAKKTIVQRRNVRLGPRRALHSRHSRRAAIIALTRL